MAYLWPGDDQLENLQSLPQDRPVTMLNLLKFREQADYSGHPSEPPCTGREAYRRYAEKAVALVEKHGGRIVFSGAAGASVIGPDDENWDDALLVEYPDPGAFFEMATSAEYQAFAYHRAAALLDSRLIPCDTSRQSYLDAH